MTLFPNSGGAVEMQEFNLCHLPGGNPQGGQFCSAPDKGGGGGETRLAQRGGGKVGAKGTATGELLYAARKKKDGLFNITTSPTETKFLLADGTRIDHGLETHEDAAANLGLGLEDLFEEGTIRVSPGHFGGFEIGQPVTYEQAQVLADDWNYVYQSKFFGEISYLVGGVGSMGREFNPPVTAEAIRNWSKKAYAEVQEKKAKYGGFERRKAA